MKCEPDAMAYDAELLRDLIDEGRLTAKRLAMLSGRDGSTIYRYLQGEKTVPSEVLRAAFRETLDLRLLCLVTGDVQLTHLPAGEAVGPVSPQTPARIPPLGQCLDGALAAIEDAAKSGKYMQQILADGRYDTSDARAAANFKKHACEAIRHLTSSVAALQAHEQRMPR